MATLSSWTDEEYATVATALLYPASRLGTVVIGYSPAAQIAYQLGGKLEQIPPALKPRVLLLALQVQQAEDRLTAQALGGGGGGCGEDDDRDIIQIGDIKFDRSRSRGEVESQVGRLRKRLADMIDFTVNPGASTGAATGGINGTWST